VILNTFKQMRMRRDFEHIAAAAGQPHRWVVPPGTLN